LPEVARNPGKVWSDGYLKYGAILMKALFQKLLSQISPSLIATSDAGCAGGPDLAHVAMPTNGWRSIDHPAGLSMQCLQGRVVITQEGDPRDLLLVAGESYEVSSDEHLYVQAERDAVLQFTSAGGSSHNHSRVEH
jgi:hypothetical protein